MQWTIKYSYFYQKVLIQVFYVHIQGGYERYLAFEVLSFQELFKFFGSLVYEKALKNSLS